VVFWHTGGLPAAISNYLATDIDPDVVAIAGTATGGAAP
jgi:hypothetical protein